MWARSPTCSAGEWSERAARGPVARGILDHVADVVKLCKRCGEDGCSRESFPGAACGMCWDLKITCLGSAGERTQLGKFEDVPGPQGWDRPGAHGRRPPRWGPAKGKGTMKSRREFLKEAADRRRAAGHIGRRGEAGVRRMLEQRAAAGKSKVVIARDASLHGAGAQPDEQRVLNLLDKAMAAFTGREKPVEAWKSIIPAEYSCRQNDRPEGERPGWARHFNACSADPGDCRAPAAGRRARGKHPGVGARRAQPGEPAA